MADDQSTPGEAKKPVQRDLFDEIPEPAKGNQRRSLLTGQMQRLTLPDDEVQRLCQAYKDGEPATSLARTHRICLSTMLQILRRGGATIRPASTPKLVHKLNSVQEADAVSRYLAGEASREIGIRFGVSRSCIRDVLKRAGIEMRGYSDAGRRFTLNQEAFADAENNELAAYFAGLLMADGCVTCRRNKQWVVHLTLMASDRAIVEQFRSFLQTDAPIRDHAITGSSFASTGRAVTLAICSKRIAESLARYGIVPRKSFTAKVLRLETNHHFWRGMVCGDGWLTFSRGLPAIGFTGSRDCCEQFLAFARTISPSTVGICPNGSIWRVVLSGYHAYHVIDRLYGNCAVALPRKLAIAKGMLADFSRFATSSPPRRWLHLTADAISELHLRLGSWASIGRELGIPKSSLLAARKRLGLM